MRHLTLLLLCTAFACAPAVRAPSEPVQVPAPPATRMAPVTDTLHGVAVTDPYRWLENLQDSSVVQWLRAQRIYADSVLSLAPAVDSIAAELKHIQSLAGTTIGLMKRAGEGLVYQRRDPGDAGTRYVFRETMAGPDRTLLDPARIAAFGAGANVLEWHLSPNGRFLLFRIGFQGKELGTAHVLDIRTNQLLADSIPNVFDLGGGGAPWHPASNAFVYRTGVDDPIRLHRVATAPRQDVPIFGSGVATKSLPGGWTSLGFAEGSRWALATLYAATGSEMYVAPVDSLDGTMTKWRRVVTRAERISRDWAIHGDDLYAMSDRDAPMYKIVRFPLDADRSNAGTAPETVLQGDPGAAITSVSSASDALYVARMRNALSEVVRVPYGGTPAMLTLPFQGVGASYGAASNVAPGFVFTLEAWAKSMRAYAVDASGLVRPLELSPPPAAEALLDVQSTEVHARSADGTMVPMSIAFPRGMVRDGSHPVRLEVYASHGVSVNMYYAPYYAPWYSRGGVQAECYARGGGELGAKWHEGGRLENLGNRIADVIACAEYLVANRYTSPGRIATVGASAGGLPAGSAAVARPDLFGAAVLASPVLDLLRLESRPMGQINTAEYGSIRVPAQFTVMHTVSPVDNVRSGVRYPAMLLKVGINDPRVSPSDAAKLAARLQAASTGGPVLLHTNFVSGHYGNGPTLAQELAFLLWQLSR